MLQSKKTKQVIEREETLKLNQADATLLMKAPDLPATENSNLQAASERYKSRTR